MKLNISLGRGGKGWGVRTPPTVAVTYDIGGSGLVSCLVMLVIYSVYIKLHNTITQHNKITNTHHNSRSTTNTTHSYPFTPTHTHYATPQSRPKTLSQCDVGSSLWVLGLRRADWPVLLAGPARARR